MTHAVGVGIGSAAMNTSIGNQTITVDCHGATPKAALIVVTRAITLGTIADGAMISVAITDGTNHRLISCMSEDGAVIASHNAGRRVSNADIIQVLTTGSEALDGSATFVSFGADAITISVDDAPSTAVQIMVYAFFGDTLRAAVNSFGTSAVVGTEVESPSIGFKPRALICLGAPGGYAPASAVSARFSFGVCAFNSDTDTIQGQCGMPFFERNVPTLRTATGGGFRTDTMLQRIIVAADGTLTEEGRYEVTAVTADTFKITTRAVANATNVAYLALYLGNLRAWVAQTSIGTNATGNKSVTGPGFRPQAVFCLSSSQTTVNAYVSNAESLHFGFGGSTVATSLSACYESEDNATPAGDTRSMSAATMATILDDSAGTDWSATLVSFDATGFTVNVGTASAADRLAGFLAIEQGLDPGIWDAFPARRWRRCLARR